MDNKRLFICEDTEHLYKFIKDSLPVEQNFELRNIELIVKQVLRDQGFTKSLSILANSSSKSDLIITSSEVSELSRLYNKFIDLEVSHVNECESTKVYSSFLEELQFTKPHLLLYERLMKCIEAYMETHCKHSTLKNQIRKYFIDWLAKKVTDEQLINKFNKHGFKVNLTLKSLLRERIKNLSDTEKSYVKAIAYEELLLNDLVIKYLTEHQHQNLIERQAQLNFNLKKRKNLDDEISHAYQWKCIVDYLDQKNQQAYNHQNTNLSFINSYHA